MAVLAQATASGRQLFQGQPTATAGIIYTAPAANANVTAPSATAYIKEIIIANTTSATASVYVMINGNGGANSILYNVPIAANDTKILSGLNTMIPASGTIQVTSSPANAITLTISGVEIQ